MEKKAFRKPIIVGNHPSAHVLFRIAKGASFIAPEFLGGKAEKELDIVKNSFVKVKDNMNRLLSSVRTRVRFIPKSEKFDVDIEFHLRPGVYSPYTRGIKYYPSVDAVEEVDFSQTIREGAFFFSQSDTGFDYFAQKTYKKHQFIDLNIVSEALRSYLHEFQEEFKVKSDEIEKGVFKKIERKIKNGGAKKSVWKIKKHNASLRLRKSITHALHIGMEEEDIIELVNECKTKEIIKA